MWALDRTKDGHAYGRKDAQLARYFKLEYGEAEVDRLVARTRAEHSPSPWRFWARRQSGGRGRRSVSRSPIAVPSASTPSQGANPAKGRTPSELPVDCAHVEWEALGSGGSTTYLQCKACGALLVSQGDRLWSFGRTAPKGI